MAENPSVRVILNPTAASGGAMRRIGEVGEALRRYDLKHEIVLTRACGHAAELARAAAADGVDVVAVVGGDGTLNEVVQAYVGEGGAPVPGPDLALLPCGTGGDFKRTLGLSGTLDEAASRIRHGSRRPIDLGLLRFGADGGPSELRAFVNVASFGVSGQVDAIVNRTPKWLGGRVSFFSATLRAMASYRNASVRVKVDGRPFYEGPVFNVAVANGRFFGGGMMIAPQADPSDGRLEVVVLGDLARAEVLALSAKIYRGAHLSSEHVTCTHGAHVEAEPVHPWAKVLLDVDGEQPGSLPARVEILPSALTFRL
jgi:diacylglycerol kinase (ATP)